MSGTRRKVGIPGMYLWHLLCLSLISFGFTTAWAETVSERCSFADISAEVDGRINLEDFSVLAAYWLSDCNVDNLWCEGADFDDVDGVDAADLMIFLACWCAVDTDPPSLDPALWQVSPQIASGSVDTVEMVAAQVRDAWWPDRAIEYYFDCTDPADDPDRAWSADRSFMASGLLPGSYRFVVRARDGSGNETPDSMGYIVAVGEGTNLPKAEWVREPNELTVTSIDMETRAYEDYEGMLPLPPAYTVKYEFEETFAAPTGEGDGRGYSTDPAYTDTVVTNNQFSYRVRMGLFYETPATPEVKLADGPWSDEVSVVLGVYDTTKPTPDPAEFEMTPECHKVNPYYYHGMKAVVASDESGVEYRFVCSDSDYSSGWRNAVNTAGEIRPDEDTISGAGEPISGPEEYWVRLFSSKLNLTWRVQYRDGSPQQDVNMTELSSPTSVTKKY